MTSADRPSITAGVQDVIASFTDVVRNEGRLAKAEAGAAIKDVSAGIGLLAVALAVGIPAITMIGIAASDVIAEQTRLTHSTAAAIVGAVLALVCVLLLLTGRKAVGSDHIAMHETKDNIALDIKTVKETVQ